MKFAYGMMMLIVLCFVNMEEIEYKNKGMDVFRRNRRFQKEKIVNVIGKCLLNKTNISEEVKKELIEKINRNDDIKDVIKKVLVKNQEEVLSCFELSKDNSIEENKDFDVKEYIQCLHDNTLQWTINGTSTSIAKRSIEDVALISQLYLALRTYQFDIVKSIEKELLSKNNSVIMKCSIYHRNHN